MTDDSSELNALLTLLRLRPLAVPIKSMVNQMLVFKSNLLKSLKGLAAILSFIRWRDVLSPH